MDGSNQLLATGMGIRTDATGNKKGGRSRSFGVAVRAN